MSFLDRLLGRQSTPARGGAAQSRLTQASFPPSQGSTQSESPSGVRKELLRLVLREALKSNGLPLNWVSVDPMGVNSPTRGAGIHVRLVLKHWDERFPIFMRAFQDDFETRLLTLDPLASQWLSGMSWQFELGDSAHWPPMPPAALWQSPPAHAVPAADAVTPALPLPRMPEPTPAASVAAPAKPLSMQELERQFAAGDQRFVDSHDDFAPTEGFAPTQAFPPDQGGQR